MNRFKSAELFKKAKIVMPGGVNSPVRSCLSVGMDPIIIDHANGCLIYDVDNNDYIDYICSWGAIILGHRYPVVIKAIEDVLKLGISYGAPTNLEIILAEMIVDIIPSVEMIRMVNSGTEATMSAIRLARAFTGREKIIKFEGCYHGHVDALLLKAGSGVATLGIPGSPGIPYDFTKHTISLPYNNIEVFRNTMKKYGDEIACVIVEPVAGNMGLISAEYDFLKEMRILSDKTGSVLIFDEVMTGFRIARGGAQEIFGIKADLTCFGKVIGGGLPVGAYGGRREIMTRVAPEGDVYQAGTLSGNPVVMTAGIATLKELNKPNFYLSMNKRTEILRKKIEELSSKFNIPVCARNVGSMLCFYFNDKIVNNFSQAKKSNIGLFSKYYKIMLECGIYLPPSQFESLFVSYAHSVDYINKTILALEYTFDKLTDYQV